MKTLADIKRRACKGAQLTMTHHSWHPNGKLIGLPRVVSKTQGNAIVLAEPDSSSGSWLYWPKAKEVRITGPDTFDVKLSLRDTPDWATFMSYEFGDLS